MEGFIVIPLPTERFDPVLRRWQTIGSRSSPVPPPSLCLLTWNVDFMAPNAQDRIIRVLTHIRDNILGPPASSPGPCCILLQEISTSAFPALLAHDWVRRHFSVVPSSPTGWPRGASYGNVTLVSHAVPIRDAHSLVFGNSVMGRNALVVDVQLRPPPVARTGTDALTLRIANTHLESLPQGAPARPVQLAAVAEVLRGASVDAGAVGGDMNAIGADDAHIHTHAGLQDAYSGAHGDERGFTWGFQPRSRFPAARIDKILYTPGCSLRVDEPVKVGVGLKTAQGQWASDHYGLVTTVSFEAG
ncbi:Endonuclease/exonuclease/phosphatase [Amylocystis lapponica]|nr:Endonuclease/exonuclease/phosphatase [Amylocystis lapponica]